MDTVENITGSIVDTITGAFGGGTPEKGKGQGGRSGGRSGGGCGRS